MNEEYVNESTTKIQQYGWTVKNDKGVFMLLNKNVLLIDRNLQRSSSKQVNVLKIASEWSWVACGTLTVRNRDGAYYVIDGQHRKEAAMKRADITELPCMVFSVDSKTKEAEAFIDINKNRLNVLAPDRYKCSLITGDKDSLFVNSLLLKYGYTIGSCASSNVVSCVQILLNCAKQNSDLLERLWPLIVDVFNRQPILSNVVKGLWVYESNVGRHHRSLLDKARSAKLIKVGPELIDLQLKKQALMDGMYTVENRIKAINNVMKLNL